MFRIRFYRDVTNKDPKKRRKIKGIIFYIGRGCRSACYCDCASKCRYRQTFKWHNFSCRVRNWFYAKFKIKLPLIISFSRWDSDLSGTTKCPHHKPRRFTCWDCKNSYGMEYCIFEWQARKACDDPDWPSGRCGNFEPLEWALEYNKRTGEFDR